MATVGLLFGSFNPVHHGHLLLATYMREAAQLDEVWLVVSPQNPFKSDRELEDEHKRLHMAELACMNHEFIKVCALEFQLDKPSYTYITIQELLKIYPEHSFKLIIGGDNVPKFKEWKNAEWILKTIDILVYKRSTQLLQMIHCCLK
jgi:nicotinate-nucleotide adenylyltransferase